MANYSLRCGDCKKEYNIETADEDLLPSSAMRCRFCKSKKMGLIEFYLNDKARIEHLYKVSNLSLQKAIKKYNTLSIITCVNVLTLLY